VAVTGSAKGARIGFTAAGIGTTPTTIEIAGNAGTEQLSFAASAHDSAIAFAINQIKGSTGVSATVSGSALRLQSTAFGSTQFVSVKTISGTFATSASKTFGSNASVNINGATAEVDGLNASLRNNDLDVELRLDATWAQSLHATSFQITGGGAKFQLGSEVNSQGQATLGIGSVSTTKLGNEIDGFLSSLGSGGPNSLTSGNTVQGQKIINAAIRQVATLRGRLGAFQKDTINTNTNSLNVALENVTASESDIRDADFATETAAMTRAQVLVQANTSVLAQANSAPQNVLSLLRGG
jgi:flagellin